MIIYLLALGIFSGSPLRAADEISATVAVPQSIPPYYQMDDKGNLSGFAIDVMEHLAAQSNISISYTVLPTWQRTMNALLDGQADLIPNVSITPERQVWINFTSPVETFAVSIFVRSDNYSISSTQDLWNSRVATVRSNVGAQMTSQIEGVQMVTFNDPEEALFCLLSGNCDALIYHQPVIVKLARDIRLDQHIKTVGEPLAEVKRAIAIRIGREDLLERLQPAVEEFIGSSEYQRIYTKWFGTPTPFWTIKRTILTMGTISLLIILAILSWRNRTFRTVNEKLLDSIRKQEEAQKEREKLIAAIEQASENILITDTNGTIEYVNPAFSHCSGYSPDEAIGQTPSILNSGQHDRQFYQQIWQTISQGQPWQGQITNRRHDGRLFEESKSITPVRDQSGRITNYVAVSHDITDQLQLEKQLRQSQKMEALGRLASGIAHDFNNILAIIMGYAEMGRDEPGSARYHEEIILAGERAKELVNQILAFSRQTDQELKPMPIVPMLRDSLKMLRSSIPRSISFETDLPDDQLCVLGDPTLIHQIMMNLCTNAYHAMRESGGTLKVSLQTTQSGNNFHAGSLPPGPCIQLTVSDNGHGIAPEHIEHIFDPYFTTKDQGEGTGLGLSIVLKAIERLGGRINCHSELDKGTTFIIHLPIVASMDTQTAPATDQPIPTGREHIVVVDDERDVREVLKRVLKNLGYEVTVLANASDALQAISANPEKYDMLITDMNMPQMSGLELSQTLLRSRNDFPIILCTGFSDQIDAQRAHSLGIKGFITKPFNKNDLARNIRGILDN